MNWRRLHATLQSTSVVWGSAVGASIFFAMLATRLCRLAFKLAEGPAMLFLFCPLCLLLVVYWFRALPPRPRAAGMINDDPWRFGPWFRH